MRRCLAVLLSAGVFFTWWLCQGILVEGQVNTVPQTCVDVNADGRTDVSDAVYLIEYLFGGGPRPACATAPELEARVSALEETLSTWADEREFSEKVAGLWYIPRDSGSAEVFMMLSAAGGYVDIDANDFARDMPTAPPLHHTATPGHWERTGEDEIRVTAMEYAWNEQGEFRGSFKQTFLVRVSEDGNTLTGRWCQERFGPEQDPSSASPIETAGPSPEGVAHRLGPTLCLQ